MKINPQADRWQAAGFFMHYTYLHEYHGLDNLAYIAKGYLLLDWELKNICHLASAGAVQGDIHHAGTA